MDRKLTANEKVEYRKQHKGPSHTASGLWRISYKALSVWAFIITFLATPYIVETVVTKLGLSSIENLELSSNHDSDHATLRVYAARTWGPKGIFAVHSWIAMKKEHSEKFEVVQVIGWRQDALGNVLFRETNVPIDSWWGNEATLLLDLHGPEVASIIDKVDAAIMTYPWKQEYTLYPGPNSNTFTAWIGLQVPEMGLDLPATAIGKDWRPLAHSLGPSASGTGIQASLYGLLGTSVGSEEGLELNILGLNFELDLLDMALELPLFGRYEAGYLVCFILLWVLVRKWLKKVGSKSISIV